ncbi:DDE-type integrase/transposase/recombinase [Streptomyces sp. NPDC000851]
MTDFTHVATWAGVVYVAFVVDTFSRCIVGWSAATTQHTQLVLDALEMALWQRDRDGRRPGAGGSWCITPTRGRKGARTQPVVAAAASTARSRPDS